MDTTAVMQFMGTFVNDLAAAGSVGGVVIGHRLGLYGSLAQGPATADEFAARTGCHIRYLTEWLRGQAASGYLNYDPQTTRFSMTEEQAFGLADPEGPLLPAAATAVLGYLRSEPQLSEAFRTGEGVAWHEQSEDVFVGTDMFYRFGYVTNLIANWIPALDGVQQKLEAGATIADVGCGLGTASILLAEAFPASTVTGSDYHGRSIDLARKKAAEAGVADRVSFEIATADAFSGRQLDLVTTFDCLHDMGDPVAAARRIRSALAEDGTWMLVEPLAADEAEHTFNPVGRLYYAGSLFLCVPNALSQSGGAALGAQAGPAATRAVAEAAGFTRFRLAASTAFNAVYEIRP